MKTPKTKTLLSVVGSLLAGIFLGVSPPAWAGPFDVETKIAASDAAEGDNFGTYVGISGTRAIVGAQLDDDACPGDILCNSGSAYLFDVTTGNQLFKFTASDAAGGDVFGSVAISGNAVLVGAYQNDDAGSSSGSAYLFDVTTGDEMFKLTASDAAVIDGFGQSVAISGNTAIVGAPFDDDACPSDSRCDSGSAYLFDVSTGDQLFKLTATDHAADDRFGISVAISGSTAIVGAYWDDDDGNRSGSAYLFDVTTGEQLSKLTANDAAADDWFGRSVAISGNVAIVGASLDDDACPSDSFCNSGSAYLFDVLTGDQLLKLTAGDATADDGFGQSVAISGNRAIVGAVGDDAAGYRSGSAYLFDIITGSEVSKLTASDAAEIDFFGVSVAISDAGAVVGAYYDDDAGNNSGSAYLFTPEPSSLLLFATGLLGAGFQRRCRGRFGYR